MHISHSFIYPFVPAFGAVYSALPALKAFQALYFRKLRYEFLASLGIDFGEGIWVIDVPSKQPNCRTSEKSRSKCRRSERNPIKIVTDMLLL